MSASNGLPLWTCQFPISLAVEGPDCYNRMRAAGADTVLFCSMIYAPYRLVLPRYPDKGIYSLEEGQYLYCPEPERYADLPVSPVPSTDFSDRDLLAEMVAGARAAGIRTGVWLTVFANGRTAKLHPDWAVENLYGSRDRLFLDFDHPEVREYSLRVTAEIAERYDVDEIMFDKIPQTCLEVNSFAGRIDPVLRTLGSLCFSSHAAVAAAKHDVDLWDLRDKALTLAAESLAVPPHLTEAMAADFTGDTGVPLLFLDHPWVPQLLQLRLASVRSFLQEARERVSAVRPSMSLSAAFVPPVKVGHDASSPRPWLGGQSYRAYRDSALDLIHSVVHWDSAVVEHDTRRAVAAVDGGPQRICTHIKAYGSTSPDDLGALVNAAARGGAHGVGYFCYDLMSEPMLAAAAALPG